MRISDWSSDVCSSDLPFEIVVADVHPAGIGRAPIGDHQLAVVPEVDPRRRRKQAERHEHGDLRRSEEHTSELQSLMRISYAVFCLKKKKSQSCLYHYVVHSRHMYPE